MQDLISEDVWPQFFCAFECFKQQCPCADPSELKGSKQTQTEPAVNSKKVVS